MLQHPACTQAAINNPGRTRNKHVNVCLRVTCRSHILSRGTNLLTRYTQSHSAVPDRAQLARLSRGWQCQGWARASGFPLSPDYSLAAGTAANPAAPRLLLYLKNPKPSWCWERAPTTSTAMTTTNLFNQSPAGDCQQNPSERQHSSDEPANSSLLPTCLFWGGAAIEFRSNVFSLRNAMCCFIPSLWFPPG